MRKHVGLGHIRCNVYSVCVIITNATLYCLVAGNSSSSVYADIINDVR